MNKKFSTLVAGLLLASSVGTVSAANFKAALPGAGQAVTEVTATQYYQLAGITPSNTHAAGAATEILAMQETAVGSGTYAPVFVDATTDVPLNNTLWSVTWRDNGYGTLLFTLTNKGTGETLSVNTKDAIKGNAGAVDGSLNGTYISEWRLSNIVKENTVFFGAHAIEASFANGDSIVSFTSPTVNQAAVAVKEANNTQVTGALALVPYTANPITLTAFDLNTRLHTTVGNKVENFNLKFSPEAVNNQWKNLLSGQTLVAEAVADVATTTLYPHANDAAYTAALATAAQSNDDATWVRLKDNAAASKKYVYVDTAFVATNNVAYDARHLKFALDTLNSEKVVAGAGITQDYIDAMSQRAMFQFTLFPSNDSLSVRVGNADVKKEATSTWISATKGLTGDYSNLTAAGTWATLLADLDVLTANKNGAVTTAATDAKLVKLVYLTEKTSTTAAHSEVTVGAAEAAAGLTPSTTVRTKITLTEDALDARVKTTIPSGLYFINLNSGLASRAAENGGYKIIHLNGDKVWAKEDQSQLYGTIQNFGQMPATQWVVEQSTAGKPGEQRVSIYNREYPNVMLSNVQLYKAGNGSVEAVYATTSGIINAKDSVSFNAVKDVKPAVKEAYTETYFGYKTIDSMVIDEKLYNLDYLSGIQMGNYVNVLDSKSDTLIRVDLKGEKVNLALETAPVKAEGYYGYNGVLTVGANKLFPQVRRTAYNVKVKDANKLIANYKYVVKVGTSATGEPMYAISNVAKDAAATFFLKENNRVVAEEKETPYFALVDAVTPAWVSATDTLWTEGVVRAGIKDGSLLMTQEAKTERRVAAFALTEDNSPLYRRLGVSDPKDGFMDLTTDTAKIYRINATAREYLYEDAQSIYSKEKGINFLGVEGKGDSKNASLFVDTAYVRNQTNMPQYMLAVGAKVVPAGMMCPENDDHNTPEYIANHGDCGHKVPTKGYVIGRYLINAEDSVHLSPNGKNYVWNEKYTRLAFVEAKHIEDTLVIYRNGKPSTAAVDSIFLGNNNHNKVTESRPYGIKNPVFAFRLINDEPQCDFLIESAGNHKIPTDNTGKWVAVKNGVPVVAAYATYSDAILDAERFNIEKTNETPTSNGAVTTSEVSVISSTGSIIVKGAAGKAVTISNILGQVIAKTVLTSDNATISVPAGIVAVAVEGEEAVKAVVR